MDYQKARQIRKKSLLSLINEQKFSEGKSLGASIGGAISQRAKAKATGIKESLDPLNWVRKVTGKGALGDFAVSGLGRMFGRSDKDIKAFGGIGRKKVKSKKDPRFTTISAGSVKPVKAGDSISNVLAKIYNFMSKSDEKYTLNREIDKTFRQEEMDEDDDRHDKLVEAIKKYMKAPKEPGQKDESWLDKIIRFKDEIIKMIQPILDFIKSKIFDVLNSIKGPLLEFLGGDFMAVLGLPAVGLALSKIFWDWSKDKEQEFADKGNIRALEAQIRGTSAIGGSEVMSVQQEKIMDDLVGEKLKTSKTPEGQAAYQIWLKDHPEKTDKKVYNKDMGVDELAFDYLKTKGYKFIREAPEKEQKEAYVWAKSAKDEIQKGGPVELPKSTPISSPTTQSIPAAAPQPASAPTTQSVPASAPQLVPQSANPPVPVQSTADEGSAGDTKPIVSVNNKTTTIGNNKTKVKQTSTAMARNDDIMRQLRNISVPV